MAHRRRLISATALFLILLTLLVTRTHGAQAIPVYAPGDTTLASQQDSTRIEERRPRFIPNIGSLTHSSDSSSLLHSSQFIWTYSQFAGEVLQYSPGVFTRELGEPGQPMQLTMNGIDGRGVAIKLDGRPLNDPLTGTYDLNLLPLEYVDQLELLNESQSGYFGNNAPGGAINAVTRQYNSNRPITKIRYMQGPFEQILTDGLYTQNVARGVNVMFGFQRSVSDGRYPNSAYDAWNIRTRVRYDHSDRWNFWISDLYTRSATEMNGGIDPTRSPSLFDEVTAVVRTEEASQTTARRDVTVGGVARLFPDTTARTKAWLYYSTIDREYREGIEPFDSARIVDNTLLSFWGAQLEQQFEGEFARLAVGGEYERRSLEKNLLVGGTAENYLAFKANVTVFPLRFLTMSAFVREELLRGGNAISFGGSAALSLTDWISITAGYSSVNRFATMQEYYWRIHSPDAEKAEKELHRQAEVGVRFHAGPTIDFSLTGFRRTIDDAIVFQPLGTTGTFPTTTVLVIQEAELRGLRTDLLVRAWNVEGRATATLMDYTQDEVEARPVPRMNIHAELSYREQFFDEALEAKVGIRVRSQSTHDGLQFIPQHLLFTRQSAIRLGAWSSLDLYTVVTLGDAFLTLAWENVADVHYMITPSYPMPGRNIKLGVNWMFLD
ncbi:MAG: hypothetical protein A2059_00420 [Ignavibacteria bacterium GWA2_55_25]|nr:MAG: hypothetical protein A2059_00420 [Ignavibacteria bacterium GWA2_55_25]